MVKCDQNFDKNKKSRNVTNCKKAETEKIESEASIVEIRLKDIENDIREIESSMDTSGSDFEELNRLYTRKEELSRKLDAAMEEWLSLN